MLMTNSFAAYLLVVSAFFCCVVTPAFAQQDVVPGGKNATGSQIRNEYNTMVKRGLQIFNLNWEKACNKGKSRDMADLYLKGASILTFNGNRIRGRDSISMLYKRALPRMSACRMTYDHIVASGDLAAINGRIRYEVKLPTGGTIAQTESFQMTLRLMYIDEWLVESQTGGDFPPVVTVVAEPRDSSLVGSRDSITVRLTDQMGNPLQNVLVSFGIESGDGRLAPVTGLTDQQGKICTVFVAGAGIGPGPGTQAGATTIRVTSSASKEAYFISTSATQTSATPLPNSATPTSATPTTSAQPKR